MLIECLHYFQNKDNKISLHTNLIVKKFLIQEFVFCYEGLQLL